MATLEQGRAAYEVVAGVLPGQPMPEYTRQWFLTTAEWGDGALHGWARLDELRTLAEDYARTLPFPGLLNWVRIDVVWY